MTSHARHTISIVIPVLNVERIIARCLDAVAEDNRDRKALYRELAVANGHPEWEAQLRDTWAKEWIAKAHKGWWYQDGGARKQK